MLVRAMHNQNNILGTALAGLGARIDVYTNNLANNDVPGFSARTVDFEQSLINALDNWRATGELNLSNVRPTVREVNPNLQFRMDGSDVDVETEMARLYTTSIKYEALVNSILNNSRRLNTVITGR